MKACCAGAGCAEFFTERVARRDAKRYRRKGLDGVGRRIVELVLARGIDGASLLEVGGGVGAIQLELLKAGAARSTVVELSAAYESVAAELALEASMADRIERRLGNFADEGDEVARADVVVLNKVVCCYPDYGSLVGAAAEHADRLLVMTFPRNALWMRLGVGLANGIERLRRQSFRAYVHPPRAIVETALSRGFRLAHEHVGAIWQLVALERL